MCVCVCVYVCEVCMCVSVWPKGRETIGYIALRCTMCTLLSTLKSLPGMPTNLPIVWEKHYPNQRIKHILRKVIL